MSVILHSYIKTTYMYECKYKRKNIWGQLKILHKIHNLLDVTVYGFDNHTWAAEHVSSSLAEQHPPLQNMQLSSEQVKFYDS